MGLDRMKGFVLILFLICLSCSPRKVDSTAQLPNDSTTSKRNHVAKDSLILSKIFADHFRIWFEYQESTYGKIYTDSFKVERKDLLINTLKELPPVEYLNMLGDYFFYSKDSSKLLDIYSGTVLFEKTSSNKLQGMLTLGSDIVFYDQKIQTKNHIEFERTYCTLDEAIWISDNEIVIVGDKCFKEDRELSVWDINLRLKKVDRYFLNYVPKQFGNEYLTDIKLKDVNIYLDDQ